MQDVTGWKWDDAKVLFAGEVSTQSLRLRVVETHPPRPRPEIGFGDERVLRVRVSDDEIEVLIAREQTTA